MTHILHITTPLAISASTLKARLEALSYFPYAFYVVHVSKGAFAVTMNGDDCHDNDIHGGYSDLLADVDRALYPKKPTTQAQAREAIKALGMRFKKTEAGDFRVSFPDDREAQAYYTDDLDDAVATAKAMALGVFDPFTGESPFACM